MNENGAPGTDTSHEQVAAAVAFARRTTRFWRTAVGIVALCALACGFVVHVRPPQYRSETVFLYAEGPRPGEDPDRASAGRGLTVRLKELLLARTSLEPVVRELSLYPDVARSQGEGAAVEELRKHVEFRAPGGDTFTLAFTGGSPSEAQTVTKRLAEVVIEQDSGLRKKRATLVHDFLVAERRATEDDQQRAELALATFMAAHPKFALDATPLTTGAAIRASMEGRAGQPVLPTGATPPRVFVATRSVARPAGASGPAAAPPPGSRGGDARIASEAAAEEARARAALAAAQANLADVSARFTPAHPDVRSAQADVDRATSRLAAATAALAAAPMAVAAAPPPATPAPDDRATSAGPVARPTPHPAGPAHGVAPPTVAPSQAVASAPPEAEVVALETEWVKLTRAVAETRQHVDQVEAALFRMQSAGSSPAGDPGVEVTLIDPAYLPQSAVRPGRAEIIALFAVGALLLAALGAALRALLDDRIFEARDVAPLTMVLVEVPGGGSHVPRA